MLGKEFENYAVSEGTLRLEDLIPRMWEFIEEHGTDSMKSELIRNYPYLNPEHPIPLATEVHIMDEAGDWELHDLYEDMLQTMHMLAPSGCYFGSHEGDGALFGFWQVPDEYMY